jgi:hypothetical protein
MTRPFNAPIAAITGLGFGVFATYLLFEQRLGLGYALFAAGFVALLLGLAYAHRHAPLRANLWLAAPLLFFSLMVTLRTNGTLTLVNILAGLVLATFLVATWDRHPLAHLSLFGYGLAGIVAGTNVLVRPFLVLTDLIVKGAPPRARMIVRPVIVGILIALPFLCVFALLFAAADAIYAQALGDLVQGFDLGRLIAQILFALFFSYLAVGALDLALARRTGAVATALGDFSWGVEKPDARAGGRGPLGIIETSVVLALVLALFVTFVIVQLRYLFLPKEQLGYAFDKITYSEYAREGFFQLILIAALVIGLMVTLEYFTRRGRPSQHWLFNGLTVALIACTLVVLVSSFRRLQLYGLEHSFTHLRFYSHSFTIWLAVALSLLLVAVLAGRPRIFAFGVFLTLIAYLAILDLINVDAFIASANLDHATVYGKDLDRRNFVPLGEDAVPVIIARLDQLDPINRRALSQMLYLQLRSTEQASAGAGWQSTNTSRQEALGLLAPRREELAASCADGLDRNPPPTRPGPGSVEYRQELAQALRPLCFKTPPGGK